MTFKKRVALTPSHPTWDIFRFMKSQPPVKNSRTITTTIRDRKYEYIIDYVEDNEDIIECFELMEMKDDVPPPPAPIEEKA